MPRILEIKEIDGVVWCRLDVIVDGLESPVSLYTASEVEALQKAERSHCRWLIEQYDMPSNYKHKALDALRGL